MIVVKIWGPECSDVTLVDLPGIVRATGTGESVELVGDIQALNKDYLSNNRVVILAVVPANVDFHNSQIIVDEKLVDPDTERTIPVITKPDLIDEGAEASVMQLLRGNKVEFGLGIAMTKCRRQKGWGSAEKAYFTNTEPWRNKDPSLFGEVELRKKLADLQINMIHKSIPAILGDIEKNLSTAEKVLTTMGEVNSSSGGRKGKQHRIVYRWSVDGLWL